MKNSNGAGYFSRLLVVLVVLMSVPGLPITTHGATPTPGETSPPVEPPSIPPSAAASPSPEPGKGKITLAVVKGKDDGFCAEWAFVNNAKWYEIGSPAANATYSAWFRFENATIPKDVLITHAYLETMAVSWTSGTHLMIRAEKSESPPPPKEYSDLVARVKTEAGAEWNSGYKDSDWHASPDISAVIQELADTFDYSSGTNALQIIIDDNGSDPGAECTGNLYESTFIPKLTIEFQAKPSKPSPSPVLPEAKLDTEAITESPTPSVPISAFTVTGLKITPSGVRYGENATASALVTNAGSGTGAFTVVCRIDETELDSREITVAPGMNESVSFSLPSMKIGTHAIAIGGQETRLEVAEALPPAPALDWRIIGAVLAAGSIGILAMTSRKWRYWFAGDKTKNGH